MSPSLIHVVACVRIYSPFKAERYSMVRPHPIVLIHSSISEHLAGVHVLATVSNSAMNMVSTDAFKSQIPVFSDIHSKVEALDPMVILLIVLENAVVFSQWLCHLVFPPTVYKGLFHFVSYCDLVLHQLFI